MAETNKDVFQVWRGRKADMPAEAEEGEPIYTDDPGEEEFHMGNGPGKPITTLVTKEMRVMQTNGTNQKVLVIGMDGEVPIGPLSREIRFPFKGKILSVSAYCRQAGRDDTQLTVQKCAEDADRTLETNWTDVASGALLAGKLANDTSFPFTLLQTNVEENDYFRVKVTAAGGSQDITIEIIIQL